MMGKITLAAFFLCLIVWAWYNNECKEEEHRLHNAYYGWLIETKAEIKLPYPEWKALYGEKYKHGKP